MSRDCQVTCDARSLVARARTVAWASVQECHATFWPYCLPERGRSEYARRLVRLRRVIVSVALLVLGLGTGVTVGVLTATGVLFGRDDGEAVADVTPVPNVIGMTKQKAVRTLRAAHLRPLVHYTSHVKGQPSGLVAVAELGSHPISVGGGYSVGVRSEGDSVQIFVSR